MDDEGKRADEDEEPEDTDEAADDEEDVENKVDDAAEEADGTDEDADDEEDDDDDAADRNRLVGSSNVGGSEEIRTFVRGGSVDDGVLRSRFKLFCPSMALMLKTGVATSASTSIAIECKSCALGVPKIPFCASTTCTEA